MSVVQIHPQMLRTPNGLEKQSLGDKFSSKIINSKLNNEKIYEDMKNDKHAASLKDHNGPVQSLAFSYDGTLLVTGSSDNTVKVYKVNDLTFELIQTLADHSGPIQSLSFNHNSSLMATGSDDNTVNVYTIQNNGKFTLSETLRDHSAPVYTVTFNHDGSVLATGSEDSSVKIYTVIMGGGGMGGNPNIQLAHTLADHTDWVFSISYNSTGTLMATGCRDGKMRLFQVEQDYSCSLLEVKKNQFDWIKSVSFNYDGSLLASGSRERSLKIYRVEGNVLRRIKVSNRYCESINSVNFSRKAGQNLLVVGSRDGKVNIHEVVGDTVEHIETIGDHKSMTMQSVLFNYNGSLLATGSEDQTVNVYKVDGNNLKLRQNLKYHSDQVLSVALSYDGRFMVSGSRDKSVNLYYIGSGEVKLLRTLKDHSNYVSTVSFNENGTILATGSWDNTVNVYRVDRYYVEHLALLTENQDWLNTVGLNHTGTMLATGSSDRKVYIYKIDGSGAKHIQTLTDHTGSIQSVEFNNDGSLLATASDDNSVNIYKIDSKSSELKLVETINDHSDSVMTLSFRNERSLLATGSKDKTVNLYKVDGHNAKLLTTVENHSERVLSVSISSDSNYLATGSGDEKTCLYRIEDDVNLILIDTLIKDHSNSVLQVAFNFNATILATASYDKTINVYNFNQHLKKFSQFSSQKTILSVASSKFDPKMVKKLIFQCMYMLHKKDSTEDKFHFLHLYHPLICAIRSGDTLLLSNALKEIGYSKIFFIGNNQKFDPFYYLIASKNTDMIKTWIESAAIHNIEYPPLTCYLIDLINKSNSPDLIEFMLLSKIFGKSIPHKIQNPKILPIDSDIGYTISESNQYLLNQKIVEKLSKEAPKNTEKQICEMKSSRDKIDLSIFNTQTLQLLHTFKRYPRLRESKIVRAFIDRVYNKNSSFFYFYSLLYLIVLIIFSLNTIWEFNTLYMIIPFFIICILMLIYEFLVLIADPVRFFGYKWNFLDLLIYPLMTGFTIYHRVKGYEYQKKWYLNALALGLISVVYIRGVSMLKVYDEARYLISMILHVFLDIKLFLVLLLLFILLTTNMELLTRKVDIVDGASFLGTLIEYFQAVDGQYNYGYGNWDDSSTYPVLLYSVYLFSGIFTSLVLFNILIAIVSATFEHFTDNQGAINTEEQLNMVLDYGSSIKLLQLFRQPGRMLAEGEYVHVAVATEDVDILTVSEKIEEVSNFSYFQKK